MTGAISMSGGGCAPLTSMQTRGTDAAKLQQLFSKVDVNGDKSIDKTELTSLLDFVSEKSGADPVDADALLKTLDSDGSGSISESELQDNASALFDQLRSQLMSSEAGRGAPPPPGDAGDMFAGIDGDEDGAISKTELESFLSERTSATGEGPSADELIARDDVDGDGSISLEEFTAAISQEPPRAQDAGEQAIDRLIASLLDQYAAASGVASTSAIETLSVTA